MKTITFFLSFLFAIAVLQAQNYQISFTGSGESTSIDSIQVENLTQGTVISLNGNDVLYLVANVGINTLTANESNVKVYPNPMVESAFIEFANSKTELVCLEIFNEMGILIAKQSTHVQQGRQRFKVTGMDAGIYNVSVSTADWKHTAKLISLGAKAANVSFEYQGTFEGTSAENAIKSTKNLVQMQYNEGETLLFNSYRGNFQRVLSLLPTQSQTVNFDFVACTDEDDNNYAVVTIGTQTWMAENLNYETSNSWWYDNNSLNGEIYGRLYTWYAAMNGEVSSNSVPSGVQGVCPSGWHLPSDAEWDILVDYLGGSNVAGSKMKEIGTSHWEIPNSGAINSFGFTALPGGARDSHGLFSILGKFGYWWSATEDSDLFAWGLYVIYNNTMVYNNPYFKEYGFSVRCIKD